MQDHIDAQLRAFIEPRFPGRSWADDDDIFALGFVDSMFAMEVVMFVERTFAVTVPNDELQMDNFRSVHSMAALVRRISAASQEGAVSA
ncbi:acyl carrier protein [Streptosporangium sp. NPDC087985]|uniref:acyl carrier protein n=1 Tax=Streptosporangium sp. NPDC087985 TaxID=3366196 RepID=UPI0037F9F6EC